MRYFISLSYNGRAFNGWQVQLGHPSVQSELERAFSVYLGEKIDITGAGRTDSGVHAINYIAHLDIERPLNPEELIKLVYKINAILPSDIVLYKICQVPESYHARFDAIGRTYNYYVHTRKDPFLGEYSFFFPYEVDVEKMNLAAGYLIGEKDFTSMSKLHTDVKTNICTVSEAIWAPGAPLNFTSLSKEDNKGGEITTLCFTITANRFLRNMVRAVVGSLLEVGRGRKEPIWIEEVLEKKNRCEAGSSVPAHPLFLTGIEYPYKLF